MESSRLGETTARLASCGLKLKMRKSVLTALIAASAVVLTVCLWTYLSWRSPKVFRRAKESLETEIQRALPVGTKVQEVQTFLDSHQISYVEIDPNRNEAEKDTWANDTWYSGAALSFQGATPYINTIVAKCRFELEFKFDANDRLMGYRDNGACKETLP